MKVFDHYHLPTTVDEALTSSQYEGRARVIAGGTDLLVDAQAEYYEGVGEIASIPTAAAITNAIYNAVGVRVRRLPVDQETLLWAIQSARKEVW